LAGPVLQYPFRLPGNEIFCARLQRDAAGKIVPRFCIPAQPEFGNASLK
jgi:hypothetical protein